MNDEAADLVISLAWASNAIAEADMGDRLRIAAAYREAQCVIGILPDHEGRRPRTVACFERFTPLKAANDVTACGWLLAAVQERVSEHDLSRWEELDVMVG
ncbi:hypothetical protein C8J35_11520 [Rhizobium sp. PP-F2F-G38]|uniref:hypothetical protein n=1 Tax=Rhizobium sp. PP-CC-3G-465 TaxID=2135648 RepID=UPI000D8821D4|nr:hypothetical protein C8J37_12723 [Rhizobium sp. PP-WC-1G-195]PYE93251.1 hypothetical protein C8J35_11520 [Rhizobium sp. PP-F2F-G38]TCP75072.1 hypothetical protein C8J31_13419 [Rhizobium sp. PP-CC-2G-626]TCQ16174.1 hypothetical protein C8J33_1177 [Rhizobium sp. PP-CC-3G-465]